MWLFTGKGLCHSYAQVWRAVVSLGEAKGAHSPSGLCMSHSCYRMGNRGPKMASDFFESQSKLVSGLDVGSGTPSS